MVRFPQNDTCLQCHRTRAYRGGFYGMGDDALPQIDAQGVIIPSHKNDVHAGRTFTDDNGQTRVIAGCTACHSRNYYKESFANVELDANHNFPKGTSDNDVRNDLDFRPGPKSCEFCHDQAKNRANPSGNIPILQVHRDLWKHNGDMAGYTADSLLKITQTHMDTVACQTCHIRKLKDPDDTDILTQYRYRRGEDGKNTIVPYTPYIRPYWIDKTSGHVLSRTEVDAIYAFKEKGDGYITSEVKDPETGKSYEVTGWEYAGLFEYYVFVSWAETFSDDSYDAVKAFKKAYDKYLAGKGYANPDARLVYMESNEYFITHNTRPSPDAVPCADCHARKQNGAFSSLLSATGLLGEQNPQRILAPQKIDPRLLKEGLVIFNEPYWKLNDQGEITVSNGDILNATRQDPSMSGLKFAIARDASGEWAQTPLDDTFRRMGIADGAVQRVLGEQLGATDLFEFSVESADRRLMATAAALARNPLSDALYPNYRVETAVRDLTVDDRNRIAFLQLGAPASDVYSLRMVDPAKQDAKDFVGQKVIVKLPYRGHNIDPAKVKLLQEENGRWSDTGITPLLVRTPEAVAGTNLPGGSNPADPDVGGYVAFAATGPFKAMAAADAVPASGAPNRPAGSLPAEGAAATVDLVFVASVQPDASCTTSKCRKALTKAKARLKTKAKAAVKAEAQARSAAQRAARPDLKPAARAKAETAAAKKAAQAKKALQVYQSALAAVRAMHD
jgi:hypothetical protein